MREAATFDEFYVATRERTVHHWTARDGSAEAALWDDSTVYLVASRSSTAPDLRAVVAGLIETVGRPCDASTAGAACPPTGR